MSKFGPAETVYGPERSDHWATAEEAAQALVWVLDEIRDNSTLAGW